ncbi:MAG: hypothetical protein SOR40_08435, partial [Rothia sp. (in: high G+C Gram-positive bacteria)]|nr:hypothetical protein [Rothia sp. (in: high G+C Gram-positive bacteria)]
MTLDSLTPLPAPDLPAPGRAVRVGAGRLTDPAQQQVTDALGTFSALFDRLDPGQDGPALL